MSGKVFQDHTVRIEWMCAGLRDVDGGRECWIDRDVEGESAICIIYTC